MVHLFVLYMVKKRLSHHDLRLSIFFKNICIYEFNLYPEIAIQKRILEIVSNCMKHQVGSNSLDLKAKS